MNSRGPLISHRTTGDTLATSDTVAMMPTVQPNAAGTQRYREFAWLPERGVATVTDREDIPSTRENPGEAPRANARPPAEVLEDDSWLLNYRLRPSRRRPGTVKWIPTPTASQDLESRLCGPVRGIVYAFSARSAGGLTSFK